jgi:hypothetical protein
MSQVQSQRLQRTIGTLQIVIIALVVITALVHLQRGLGMILGGFGGPGGRGGPPPGGFGGGGPGGPGGPPGGFNIMRLLPVPLPMLFLLNGIGYLVLVTALYLPALAQYRSIVRWLLILFAASTIVMYLLFNGFRPNPLGIFDKLMEITLIVLLFIDGRQASSSAVEAVRT